MTHPLRSPDTGGAGAAFQLLQNLENIQSKYDEQVKALEKITNQAADEIDSLRNTIREKDELIKTLIEIRDTSLKAMGVQAEQIASLQSEIERLKRERFSSDEIMDAAKAVTNEKKYSPESAFFLHHYSHQPKSIKGGQP